MAGLGCAAVAVALAFASSADAAYDSNIRCGTQVVPNVQFETRTSEAAVFRTRQRTSSGVRKTTFACLRSTGPVRRLDNPGGQIRADDAELAGRFVGYERTDVSEQFRPSDMVVVDLRTGQSRTLQGSANDQDTDTRVRAFVLKRNGSVAWITQGDPSAAEGLWKDDTSDPDPQLVDSSPPPFDAARLRLSSDRRSVLYRHVGDTSDSSTPLR
jgi:hypothetical protein